MLKVPVSWYDRKINKNFKAYLKIDSKNNASIEKIVSEDGYFDGYTGTTKVDPGKSEESPKKGVLEKVKDFATAEAQLIQEGRVPEHVANHRLSICTGITHEGKKISDPCKYYEGEDKGWGTGHCKGCGCPKWPISEMNREGKKLPGKAWFPMGCPKGKFSYFPGSKSE